MESQDKRRSLTIRWQSTKGKPFTQVVDWLNTMSIKERRQKVADVCLMTLLPYALEANQKTDEEIERCYWEVHDRLNQYLFSMRQALKVKSDFIPRPEQITSLDLTDRYSVETNSLSNNKNTTETNLQPETEVQNIPEESGFEDIDLIFGTSK